MIAPDSSEGGNRQSRLGALLRRNLLASAFIFLVLQIWRPCFFLTDDNIDGGYPVFVELGHHLLRGQSPFYSDHLFGGHFDMLRDPTFFLWHPVYFLASLLAGTPFRVLIIDVSAFVFFMLATAGFVCLGDYLRREEGVVISDGWLMFFTLSFVYTMIAVATAASWLNFSCNHSALPWLALGILHRNWRKGVFLVALFAIHHLLGGHLAPTIATSLIFSVFAAAVSVARRSWQPLLGWVAGNIIAFAVISPLLIQTIEGFSTSIRSHGVNLDDMQANNIPLWRLPTSLFLGMALWYTHLNWPMPNSTYVLALGSGAAIWCLLPCVASRLPWRPLEWVCAGMMLFLAFLVWRPMWVIHLMSHTPVLKSLRWPFRELLQFQFFLHLLLVLRQPTWRPVLRWRLAVLSTTLFVLPAVTYPVPPTFNSMLWDRRLILSGKLDGYWTKVDALLKPGDRVAAVIPPDVYSSDRFGIPFSLVGTYNYACIAGFVSADGYSPTPPMDQVYVGQLSYFPFGAYHPNQRPALLASKPNLKFITLESLQPLKITLSSATGPTIDLTPFVPHELDAANFPRSKNGVDDDGSGLPPATR